MIDDSTLSVDDASGISLRGSVAPCLESGEHINYEQFPVHQ